MKDDVQLLRQYVTDKAEDAFAELVRRHVNFVYASALRQVGGNTAWAQDVTQSVFIDLARKAEPLSRHRVLVGWLFTSTRFAALKLRRAESRRLKRETEAAAMHQIANENMVSVDWERLRTVIDEVLHELPAADREAVLLRYFEGCAFPAVAAGFSISADAARLRVERALEKMRKALARRGVDSTVAALGIALASQPVVAAPSGFAPNLTRVALAGSSSGAGAGGVAAFLTMNKLPIALAVGLLLTGSTGYIVQAQTNSALQRELARIQQENEKVASADGQGPMAPASLRALDNSAGPNSAPGARVFELSEVDLHPRVVSQTRPVYPADLRSANISGTVVIDFIVDTTGTVAQAKVVSSTRSEFEEPALTAVEKWKFNPGEKNGAPCNTHMKVPILFTTDKNAQVHHDS